MRPDDPATLDHDGAIQAALVTSTRATVLDCSHGDVLEASRVDPIEMAIGPSRAAGVYLATSGEVREIGAGGVDRDEGMRWADDGGWVDGCGEG